MDLSRPSLRLLVLFGAVAIPPLVALAIVMAFEPDWVADVGVGTVLLLSALGGVAWAVVMAWVGSRAIGQDLSRLIELAERGAGSEVDAESLTAAQRRLTGALEERNRQIASLAAAVSAAPISGTPVQVAASVVQMARDVTGDPTWQLAVLHSASPELLPAGIYTDDPTQPPAPLEELHRWAASTETSGDMATDSRSRFAVGPWGAFLVVDSSAGEPLGAILVAPWEGRGEPNRAELDLFALLGLQSATAIDHALLFARVRNQADELNRLAAIQSDFLRGVTHDLQTPLTSIRALASELGEEPGLGSNARTDLDMIAHQAERLRRMVSQLLVASRLEVGAITPAQEVFHAQPVVRRTWDALRADRTFDLVDEGPPHLVVADEDRFEQVLWAVLDNAVKYSQPGSHVAVRLAAPVSTNGQPMQATLEVADEGSGMDAEAVARAFEQFYRSEHARRLAPDGSGVGLYAARGLVRAMGGDITLRSQLGAGTTVVITLPAEAAERAEGDPA